ncbi:MAG: glutamate--tRNA ligase [Planctomycetes bacterium]|nr:glutamate--tRNA ligase [Planctomycetota bacterium]
MLSDPIRLRFAPSPTGSLHIGGARTALFNWAYARRYGGVFLLRIEDTDRERSSDEYERAILEGLSWLGIDWDEGPDVGGALGPYRQTERYGGYREMAERFHQEGWAYRCFCSPERLAALRNKEMKDGKNFGYDGLCRGLSREQCDERVAAGEKPVLRFKVPEGETRFQDMVSGEVRFRNEDVDDWVMVRASGDPTYNFVVVCDDHDMRITHVLRGEEHLTNTPKQVLLYRALGLEPPLFGHLPLMLGKDKKKLSKRTGDTALQDYRRKGYPAEAMSNFLALQSWALDDKTTVFSRDELVANFDPKDLRKGGSIFDPDKCLWIAGEYIRAHSIEVLAERCTPFVVEAGLATAEELEVRRDWYLQALAMEQERIKLYSQMPGRLAYLFADDGDVSYDEKALKNVRKHDEATTTLADYLEWIAPKLVDGFDVDALGAESKAWISERGLKIPALFQPLRCALSGAAGGADLFGIMALLGPEKVRRRIECGIERLGA